MNKKIKLGILGGGSDSLIGILHRVAASMFDHYEIVGGIFSVEHEKSKAFAEELGMKTDRIYKDLDSLVKEEMTLPEEERMQAVSILTPNFLHFLMAKQLLENNFHVICEKPLTTNYQEARLLGELCEKHNRVFAVTYTYTGYPMIRQAKQMIAAGELGKIQKVDVQYYQGWVNSFIHDRDSKAAVWRLDPERAGISSCVGDIGTHAFNMVEYLTGQKVKEILADLNTLYGDNSMDVDGTVLLRLSEFTKGVLRSSQIATGEENNLRISIYGEKAGLKWEQENPNYLYVMREGQPLQVYKPGHSYNCDGSLEVTKLPPGHPEGIFDSMANIYRGAAKAIKGEDTRPGEYPTLEEGIRGVDFIEKTVESNKKGNIWVPIND